MDKSTMKTKLFWKDILLLLMVGATSLVFFSAIWFFATWARMTVYEFVFHFKVSLEGTAGAMIRKYIIWCVMPTTCVVVVMIVLFLRISGQHQRSLLRKTTILLSVFFLLFSIVYTCIRMDVPGYISAQMNASTFIEDQYVDPKDITVAFPEGKRNLIYIYLESMEVTFSDAAHGGAFPENLISPLTELSREGVDFSGNSGLLNGAHSMPGTDWTMGAIFAQSAGLPLQIPFFENGMSSQKQFFPTIKTMGEILQEAGYRQIYLLGSDAVFGGRKVYYESHGAYEIEDYNYALEQGLIPDGYKVWWGYEDDRLFSIAKNRLIELTADGEPFNLTMLTVDTHMEDGYLCEDCPDDHPNNPYADVFTCSAMKTTEFIRWVQEQDFYENTTIVVAGDHPTMDADFCYQVPAEYERRVYVTILNGAVDPVDSERTRSYSTFDLFPTTLAALGAEIPGEKLGLGVNLYGTSNTLVEEYGVQEAVAELAKKSGFLSGLSGIDIFNEELLAVEREEQQHVQPKALVRTRLSEDGTRMDISISDIENMPERIRRVEVEYYCDEDKGTLRSLEGQATEDGGYEAQLDLADMNLERLDINIYLIGGLDSRHQIYGQSGDAYLKQETLSDYLQALQVYLNEGRPYDIYIGTKGAITGKLSEQELSLFQKMGFMKDLEEGINHSYCASYKGGVVDERYEEDIELLEGASTDGKPFRIQSTWRDNVGEMVFDGIDRMIVPSGLHILVYNHERGYVADYVDFNLIEGKTYRRWMY